MLGPNSSHRPSRPRPAAQLRRSLSKSSRGALPTSPPPYQVEDTHSSILESSLLSSGHKLFDDNASSNPDLPSELIDWINSGSKDELSNLLLELAASTDKINIDTDLEQKLINPSRLDDADLTKQHTDLHSYPYDSSVSFANPEINNNAHLKSRSRLRYTHQGRPVIGASEIEMLADQNAELALKLEELESGSARFDVVSKRRFSALERELRTLREELENARQRTDTIEEEIKAPLVRSRTAMDGELLKLWKRFDREAKVRALKAKVRPWEDSPQPQKDFAPRSVNRKTSKDLNFLQQYPSNECLEKDEDSNSFTQACSRTPSAFSGSAPVDPAFPIISQLLLRIRELEELNNRITMQHLERPNRVFLEASGRKGEYLASDSDILTNLRSLVEVQQSDTDSNDDELANQFEEFSGASPRRTLGSELADAHNTSLLDDNDYLRIPGDWQHARLSDASLVTSSSSSNKFRDSLQKEGVTLQRKGLSRQGSLIAMRRAFSQGHSKSFSDFAVTAESIEELSGDAKSATISPDGSRKRSVADTTPPPFIMEVWLWLQFIVIIGVFVWTMARRGPKSVSE